MINWQLKNTHLVRHKDTVATRQLHQSLQLSDTPLFAPHSPAIENFVTKPFFTIDAVQKSADHPLEQITDHNMVTEFKYGKYLY